MHSQPPLLPTPPLAPDPLARLRSCSARRPNPAHPTLVTPHAIRILLAHLTTKSVVHLRAFHHHFTTHQKQQSQQKHHHHQRQQKQPTQPHTAQDATNLQPVRHPHQQNHCISHVDLALHLPQHRDPPPVLQRRHMPPLHRNRAFGRPRRH